MMTIKTFAKLGLISGLLLFLASCSQLTQQDSKAPPLPKNKQVAWQGYQKALQNHTNWQIQGAVAVRHQDQAEQASLDWHQTGLQQYQITLSGPLGIGAIELKKQNNLYSFTDSQGHSQTAASAEALMQSLLGWHLPVSGLIYWVRGLPAPGPLTANQQSLDAYGRLQTLSQTGWQIRYRDYYWYNHLPYPSLIQLYNKKQNLWVKLAIYRWQ